MFLTISKGFKSFLVEIHVLRKSFVRFNVFGKSNKDKADTKLIVIKNPILFFNIISYILLYLPSDYVYYNEIEYSNF